MKHLMSMAMICAGLAVAGCSGKLSFEEYNSAAGKYSVQMPGKPKAQSQTLPGLNVTMHTDLVEVSGAAYGVAYADLPPGTPWDYQGAIQGIANTNGGTVTKESDWKIEGATGKEAELKITKPKNGYASVRIVVVNNRLYQVLAIGTSTTLDNENVKKYFDSFKITK